jgi:predicted DCC family thiol-disulfide oxidoreductase YuxK
MIDSPEPRGRHLLLWDGDCGFCRRIVSWIERHDVGGAFEAVPYQQAPAGRVGPDVRAASEKAVHVLTLDGRVLAAGRASLFVLRELGWRRTTRVLSLPPFAWAVELGYHVVSKYRGRISRWLPNRTSCGTEGDRRT